MSLAMSNPWEPHTKCEVFRVLSFCDWDPSRSLPHGDTLIGAKSESQKQLRLASLLSFSLSLFPSLSLARTRSLSLARYLSFVQSAHA